MLKSFWYISPTRIGLQAPELDIKFLAAALTYTDPAVDGELKRLKKNRYFIQKYGYEVFAAKVEELKAKLKICLLERRGAHYETMSGFAARLARLGYRCDREEAQDDDRLPWVLQRKPNAARYYQTEACDAMKAATIGGFYDLDKGYHPIYNAAISMPTGAGKSWIIEEMARYYGKKTIIMAPSVSIAEQLYDQAIAAFGPKRVGLYGDGKKQSDKQIVIGIAASLTRAEGKHLEALKKCQVFIADESHLCPASTFEKVCTTVAADAEKRFFVSATQMRNDGTEILLEGITGPVVYKKTLRELVDEGFLARPRFFTVATTSPSSFWNGDWQDTANLHLWGNPVLHAKAAAIANRMVDIGKGPVLILVDHTAQFQHLIGGLRHEVGFAHGPLTAESKKEVQAEFQVVDNKALVGKFNDGELPILVGTSCITTGTDLRPTGTILYLMSGESEIKVRQCIGRDTRKVPGKEDFIFIDFDIEVPGVEERANSLHRHFLQRCEYYDIGDVKKLPL